LNTLSLNGSTTLITQAYDSLGRRISLGRGVSNAAGSTSYGYDNLDRLTSFTNDLNGTTYDVTWTFSSYSPANQIITWGASSTIYDYKQTTTATDNHTYDGLNRDASIAALSGGFDANGNLTYDGTRTFTYDIYNRLLTATGGGANVKLVYDPLGRLAKYSTDGGSTYTTYLYDGSNLIGEYDSSSALQSRYIFGSGTDDPLVWYQGSPSPLQKFFYTDYHGSIIGYTDSSGVLGSMHIYKYSPYGEPLDYTNTPNWGGAARFRFTGQLSLPDAKLYYYKARVYDPVFGRFLQTDPVGSKDDLDLYAYTGDDPVDKTDSSGLMGCSNGMSNSACQVATAAQVQARQELETTRADLATLKKEKEQVDAGDQMKLGTLAAAVDAALVKQFGNDDYSTIKDFDKKLAKIDTILADDGSHYKMNEKDIGNNFGMAYFPFSKNIDLGLPFFSTSSRNQQVTIIHEASHLLGENFLVGEKYEGSSAGYPTFYRLYNADDIAIAAYNIGQLKQ